MNKSITLKHVNKNKCFCFHNKPTKQSHINTVKNYNEYFPRVICQCDRTAINFKGALQRIRPKFKRILKIRYQIFLYTCIVLIVYSHSLNIEGMKFYVIFLTISPVSGKYFRYFGNFRETNRARFCLIVAVLPSTCFLCPIVSIAHKAFIL